jgi:aminoglycoside phosphotransferase (APT) family kinase protein
MNRRMAGAVEVVRWGRFVVSWGDPRVRHHFLDRHFVAHSARERVRGLIARKSLEVGLAAGARRLLGGATRPMAEPSGFEDQIGCALRRAHVDWNGSWIQLLDYPGGRSGSVTFAFPPASSEPPVVVKVRPSGGRGPSLRRESEALAQVRRRLPEGLRVTVPEMLWYGVEDGLESLVLSLVPGRPAYLDMCNLLVPGRRVSPHLEAASLWLARFHEATEDTERPLRLEAELPEATTLRERVRSAGGSVDPSGPEELEWYRRLRDRLADTPPPTSAVHGDFWARNLLLADGALPFVVDWEHYAPRGGPATDLFHFPLTYGLNHPWTRYRRCPPLAAFRRTFLEGNRVSRAVRDYFIRYGRLRGIDLELLRSLFLLHLLTLGSQGPSGMTRVPGPSSGETPWISAYRLMVTAERSVFSS